MSADFSVVGLGVMGTNLVRNMIRNGFTIAVWNILPEVGIELAKESERILPRKTLQELVDSLKKPRRVLLMVTDTAVDEVAENFKPLLDSGDILIDGGNSYWKLTEKRQKILEPKGIYFIGMGVSGGSEGALWGPSIMFGGSEIAYESCKEVLEKIGAHFENETCVARVGERGAGHFVKMVHNAIEYADLQLIGEIYFVLKHLLNMGNEEMANTFHKWNEGILKSFLIESAEIVLRKKESDNFLIDLVLDVAGQKGTGKWAAQDSFDIPFPCPAFSEAVDARLISCLLEDRKKASKIYQKSSSFQLPFKIDISDLENALYAAKVVAYAQGFALIDEANKKFAYNINISNCAKIWRSGCIIRAGLLAHILEHFTSEYSNLLFVPFFFKQINERAESWRKVVAGCTLQGISVPVLSSSLQFLDSFSSEKLSANMIQAIRDYFGSHTYQRFDKEGNFHSEWK